MFRARCIRAWRWLIRLGGRRNEATPGVPFRAVGSVITELLGFARGFSNIGYHPPQGYILREYVALLTRSGVAVLVRWYRSPGC